MWGSVVSIVMLGAAIQFISQYRVWVDYDKKFIYRKAPGPCKTVIEDGGSEDVTYIGNGKVLVSRGFDFEGGAGSVKAIHISGDNPHVIDLNITNKPNRPDFMQSPHGITTWKDPKTGKITLYVLTHPPKEDRIEVFELFQPWGLKYIKTITDPSFKFMNDMVAVDKDKFYITLFWHNRDYYMQILESWSGYVGGKVLYYDGHKAREVASGFHMGNGINISPDKTVVYVAECGSKKLTALRRDSMNNLQHIWSKDMNTVVDNIEVEPVSGDLWIGSHPVFWKIFDFPGIFGATPPSQVLRVKMRDNMVDEIIEEYADDGTELSGSTAATYAEGKLIIGTVYKQAIVCDVKYLA